MRFVSVIAFVLFVCFTSFAVFAAAGEPPKGFRTATWGSAPMGGLKKITGPTSDGTSLYVSAKGKTVQPFFEVPAAEEAYSYSNGKFFSGSVWLDGQENLERMKIALSKAYGSPTFSNEKLSIWKWKWPDSQIEVHLLYQAKFSRTTVTVLNNVN